MIHIIIKIFRKSLSFFYALTGCFIIVASWNWYHLAHRPHWYFIALTAALWITFSAGYLLAKQAYIWLVKKFNRHPFWQMEFVQFADKLFFIFSLLFLIFFSQNEILSLCWASFVFLIFFWRLHATLARHPASQPWLAVNRVFFILGYFIFLLSAVCQYLAYHYYILDSNVKFYNIVFFRSFAMTMFWLCGFAVAGAIYWRMKSFLRWALAALWSLFFVFGMFFWCVNIGILYFSSLYLSPFILSQTEGGGGVIWNKISFILIVTFVFLLALFILILKKIVLAHRVVSKRYWYFYNSVVIALAILSFFGLASFKNTPEFMVAKSFYAYFRGETKKIELNPVVKEKLERFGVHYNLDEFYIAHKEKVYGSEKKLLPEKFAARKPNIVIVFLESFSARLTGPYTVIPAISSVIPAKAGIQPPNVIPAKAGLLSTNKDSSFRWNDNASQILDSRLRGNDKTETVLNHPDYKNLTPGLEKMTADKNTTLFKNIYNGSTPTVTGLLSELCSFFPPTGHNEIEGQKHLRRVNLLCLPRVLKESGGYNYSGYITAVSSEFASKGSIFKSIGTDDFFGTEELAEFIPGEPLSWGYSDHQMFPFLSQLMRKKAAEQPFLLMLSTVDTHPPFTLAKDMVKYGDGKNDVLNSIRTTDDAFGRWWDEFAQSEFYDNTLVVAIADHAIFPTAYTPDILPAGKKYMSFYDELFFAAYVPKNILPKEINIYGSSADLTPTLLQMLKINAPNSFEGHSIFDDREKYPNILGMHEFGLFMNQIYPQTGERKAEYNMPANLNCTDADFTNTTSTQLTFCEFMNYYNWKRGMFEEGRFWER